MSIWTTLEQGADATQVNLASLNWNGQGLITAIAQDHDTGAVLMLAWMDRAALVETLETGWVCYWSRSRERLWRKGESSGNRQRLVEARLDCDADAILLRVDTLGPACHTLRESCFYNRVVGFDQKLSVHPTMPPSPHQD
ncbi:phosphoribosyl-AMP cyclohydrolase [Marinobacter sp. JSM 1782161]|uniref:phosphoribosyl-AMP cyclohydrolase n=1 Tax=Marinobacter sp. JSM 1782161 TaxID=2685906 RepID=UPI0014039DB5|nr:phosphoribosyl-AMP cyclohydrolase [Marinobacter sp. JSM 1782161]